MDPQRLVNIVLGVLAAVNFVALVLGRANRIDVDRATPALVILLLLDVAALAVLRRTRNRW